MQKILVAGSTWFPDEQLLAELVSARPHLKMLLAPHEIDENHLQAIKGLFPSALFYSTYNQYRTVEKSEAQVLVIDNIGMLSSLYGYGQVAYIGGGFGAGIHNTLEAATYGIPVLFGPKYAKFKEAVDLIEKGAGFSIQQVSELIAVYTALTNLEKRILAGDSAEAYVRHQAGATQIIMKYLENTRLFIS